MNTSSKKAFTLVELIVVITILVILGTIAFISLSGYSKEARDSKRISDVRNILNKINVEQIRGKELGTLIIDTKTESGKILGVDNSEINTFGKTNFELLKEDSKAFKDPSNKTQDYPVAYAIGGTGSGAYKFFEIATISEKENTTKIMGNYYKLETDDEESLFLTGGLAYKEGSTPIYNVDGGSVETPAAPEMEIVEVFGDENTDAINACNKWVEDNVGTKGGGAENWLWVPASRFTKDGVIGIGMDDDYYKREVVYNGKKYICNGFAVARYEMTYEDATSPNSTLGGTDRNTYAYNSSKLAISKADRYPIADINQTQAITACSGIGTGFHLITNNEWMTVARNIELRADNWSNKVVGSGYISNGLSADQTMGCVGATSSLTYTSLPRTRASKTGIGTGIGTNPDCDTKRQLALSNGENIWDLSGNLWEHVNKGNSPIDGANYNFGQTSIDEIGCASYEGWAQEQNGCWALSTKKNQYGPITSGGTDKGLGNVRKPQGILNNIFLRGSRAGDVSHNSGIFSLHMSTTAGLSRNIGFRCSL